MADRLGDGEAGCKGNGVAPAGAAAAAVSPVRSCPSPAAELERTPDALPSALLWEEEEEEGGVGVGGSDREDSVAVSMGLRPPLLLLPRGSL